MLVKPQNSTKFVATRTFSSYVSDQKKWLDECSTNASEEQRPVLLESYDKPDG